MRLQKGTPKITHGNKGWNPDMEVLKGWYCESEVGVSGFQVGTRPGDFLEFLLIALCTDSKTHGHIRLPDFKRKSREKLGPHLGGHDSHAIPEFQHHTWPHAHVLNPKALKPETAQP